MTPQTLFELVLDPSPLIDAAPAELNAVLRAARQAGVIGRLAIEAERAGMIEKFPPPVADMLKGERRVSAWMETVIRFEADRVERAFLGSPVKVCVLKGGAYILAGDKAATGRISTDLDILVTQDDLAEAEACALNAGWVFAQKTDNAYDQHYYRTWMHELPPMMHWTRGHMLDIHHTILPPSGRVKIAGATLTAKAVPLDGSRLHVLAPVDRLLHSIAHLWQDGDFRTPLRNILEQYDLAVEHGATPGFWDDFDARARDLGLQRSVGHAVLMLNRLRPGTVPSVVERAFPGGGLLHRLVLKAATPESFGESGAGQETALFLLYLRSHWLRMPPLLLAKHLWTKSRLKEDQRPQF